MNGYLNHSWTILYITTAPLDTVASSVSWLVSLIFFSWFFYIDAYSAGSREVQGHSCFALVYFLIPPSCLLLWSTPCDHHLTLDICRFLLIEPLLLVYHIAWTLLNHSFPSPFPSPPCNPVATWLTRLLVCLWITKKKGSAPFSGYSLLSKFRCLLVKVSLEVLVSLCAFLKIHFIAQTVQLLVWLARASLLVDSDCGFHLIKHNLAYSLSSQHCMWTTRPPSSLFSLLTLFCNLPTMWTTRPP